VSGRKPVLIVGPETVDTGRSHECERGTQECVRHGLLNAAAVAPEVDLEAGAEAVAFAFADFD